MENSGIEQRFDRIDEKLDNINVTLGKMAIQEEQIKTLRLNQSMLFAKYDKVLDELVQMRQFQASCPRKDIKDKFDAVKEKFAWIWVFLLPMAGSLLVISYNLLIATVHR